LDLPTYTNIWRIEKRLYKLYDFRLPMPLPVGQIAVFAAIAVPYVVILKLLGLPFSHTLLWLYILPPGALAWLVTRPVLESKRLPELVVSQLRYLSQPRTWCRMAPLAEKDEIVITARVWRRVGGELEAFAHDGECARIDRIGLCELADRFGEQTRTQRIDDRHRVACGMQRAMGLAMELAGCLDGHEDHLETGKPRLELPEPLVGVGNAEHVAKRMQINVDCRFTDIETDVDLHFGFCFGRAAG